MWVDCVVVKVIMDSVGKNNVWGDAFNAHKAWYFFFFFGRIIHVESEWKQHENDMKHQGSHVVEYVEMVNSQSFRQTWQLWKIIV